MVEVFFSGGGVELRNGVTISQGHHTKNPPLSVITAEYVPVHTSPLKQCKLVAAQGEEGAWVGMTISKHGGDNKAIKLGEHRTSSLPLS